ncbi:acyl-CoA dehydrogenase family protein [Sinosporangium siamense]|uniref:Acyl-CoA dehydrogenase n=1 Tax=Sinosporangium siamense TaxID=1367973 RepID=A0A919RJ47_9ACTN|nr:acyl-CoA dehydrogenase family protein [Sinosporangium siamense]GII92829.1 acyl-CoA dehydrogenase [Sinosporangium siamense]
MDFAYDQTTEDHLERLAEFMESHIYPAEPHFTEEVAWERPPIMAELRAEARSRGLWNLFLPKDHGGTLTTLQYAPLAEMSGRSPLIAPESMNCAAPDTGNMELLTLAATPAQREQWLEPLLDARIRSAFSMTEPEVASSDASNIATRAVRKGGEYVIDGRKWWTSGAMSSDCKIFIVMAVTDPGAPPRGRYSMLLVPRGTPGMHIKRGMRVFGYTDGTHGGHAEIVFDGVRVPAANLLGEEGQGGALAQARLGPGRVHHCMRLVGMAERAFELMCKRAAGRTTFGRPLAEHGAVEGWIADARVRIDQLRLLVLHAAWMIDKHGAKAARREISAIKIAAPETAGWVVDKAIQVHGAGGVSQDYPLAMLWAGARGLRFADGPDEVHKMVLARREIARVAGRS